jgi:hypothetical protein
MNYLEPRQKKSDMLWHYTNMNDGFVYPVGNCANDCPGHITKDGAYEHQRQYELDHARFDAGTWSGAMYECQAEGCGAYSNRFARVGGRELTLCDEHRNRETVEKFFTVGDQISS